RYKLQQWLVNVSPVRQQIFDRPLLTFLRDEFGPLERLPACSFNLFDRRNRLGDRRYKRDAVSIARDRQFSSIKLQLRESSGDFRIFNHLPKIWSTCEYRIVDIAGEYAR